MSRIPLPPRVRFEVLKRDGFRCRYCGAAAPDVALHVDHVVPCAEGGTNDPANLVTACAQCNAGKSDIMLSEHFAWIVNITISALRVGVTPEYLLDRATVAATANDYWADAWDALTEVTLR